LTFLIWQTGTCFRIGDTLSAFSTCEIGYTGAIISSWTDVVCTIQTTDIHTFQIVTHTGQAAAVIVAVTLLAERLFLGDADPDRVHTRVDQGGAEPAFRTGVLITQLCADVFISILDAVPAFTVQVFIAWVQKLSSQEGAVCSAVEGIDVGIVV
jgi:hypothetical protein